MDQPGLMTIQRSTTTAKTVITTMSKNIKQVIHVVHLAVHLIYSTSEKTKTSTGVTTMQTQTKMSGKRFSKCQRQNYSNHCEDMTDATYENLECECLWAKRRFKGTTTIAKWLRQRVEWM